MSKKKDKPATEKPSAPAPDDGYVRISEDVEGFWDGEGVVHFSPTGFKTFRSKKFPDKDSTIVFGRALSPVSCLPPSDLDANDEPFTLEAGGKVGIWYKPGMRALMNLCGAKVKMRANGEKDIGKGNPMKLYAVDVGKGTVAKPLPNLSPPATRTTTKKDGPIAEEDFSEPPF